MMPREIPTWRKMTDDERTMANALDRVSFLPATSAKRIARSLVALTVDPEGIISERQAVVLRELVHTFRRQIPKSVVALARAPEPAPAPAPTDEQAMNTLFSGDL